MSGAVNEICTCHQSLKIGWFSHFFFPGCVFLFSERRIQWSQNLSTLGCLAGRGGWRISETFPFPAVLCDGNRPDEGLPFGPDAEAVARSRARHATERATCPAHVRVLSARQPRFAGQTRSTSRNTSRSSPARRGSILSGRKVRLHFS